MFEVVGLYGLALIMERSLAGVFMVCHDGNNV